MVAKELKVPLGDLDIYYSLSSFLGSHEKMADVNIDPFGEHDKTDSHPDTVENIPLTSGGAMEEPLGARARTKNIIWRKVSQDGSPQRTCRSVKSNTSESMGQTSEAFHFDEFRTQR